jgi:uncharacterized membrane protein (DUF485 family)
MKSMPKTTRLKILKPQPRQPIKQTSRTLPQSQLSDHDIAVLTAVLIIVVYGSAFLYIAWAHHVLEVAIGATVLIALIIGLAYSALV